METHDFGVFFDVGYGQSHIGSERGDKQFQFRFGTWIFRQSQRTPCSVHATPPFALQTTNVKTNANSATHTTCHLFLTPKMGDTDSAQSSTSTNCLESKSHARTQTRIVPSPAPCAHTATQCCCSEQWQQRSRHRPMFVYFKTDIAPICNSKNE